MKFKLIFKLLKLTFIAWQKDKASRLAAALAYYTAFSLAPMLIIVIAVAGLVFGQDAAQGEIVAQLQGLVGREGAQVIQNLIENARRPQSGIVATIAGIAILLFGATGLFTQLQDALNTIWNVQPKPGRGIKGLLQKRFLSFAMVLAIAFLLLVSLAVSAGLAAMGKYFDHLFPHVILLWQVLNLTLSFAIVTVLFATIYKVLPDAKVAWSDVWMGASITSLLFAVGKWAIGLYLGNSSVGSAYGAAGSFVVILLWVNYSAQILFFGAEFTQVYANRYGSRIVPNRHAIALGDSPRNDRP
ncbi:YihY/virulence factor BrkB family protein [Oxynema sp. CENA135]|uniref:YihY/virulence factor BrkB family protein n=1 Tax=Oxynema sp. CENA135 TaxID=984206 RepID=UPI00190ACA9A|nr:YihY/virulence factor BrkB family protein [Oxynema sp. CENA135]